MTDSLIIKFQKKISEDRIRNNKEYNIELEELYFEIINKLSNDYTTYRSQVGVFLSCLEINHLYSVPYGLNIFETLKSEIVNSTTYTKFDESLVGLKVKDETASKYALVISKNLTKISKSRLSETIYDLDELTNIEKRESVSLIINLIEHSCKELDWSKELIEAIFLNFVPLRQMLKELSSIELFYHVVGLFFDRLSTSEYYQNARDIAEEIIITSFTDNMPHLGFFNSFRFYSNTNSIHAGLMYANLSLVCAKNSGIGFSEKYIKQIIWQGIKFFRNIHMMKWATSLYERIPVNIQFHDFEKRAIDHTYFLGLISEGNPTAPLIVLDYLHKEREAILKFGHQEVLPWLITLYNIRRIYKDADFTNNGFGFYLYVFETIVPFESVKKIKLTIEGDSPELKTYLKESLIKLDQTRNTSDFIYDNENAIKLSNRLIEYSVKTVDECAFVMAMLLKSDYTILFKQKDTGSVAPLSFPDLSVRNANSVYENTETLKQALTFEKKALLVWLALVEGKTYQMIFDGIQFALKEIKGWSYSQYSEVVNSDYFIDFSFESTTIKGGVTWVITKEEHQLAEQEVIRKLKFNSINIPEDGSSIYLIKDMEFSKYPHNLYIDSSMDFIAKRIPITNVLSTEWLLKVQNEPSLRKEYTKAIWIPTEGGDVPLNYLYSNIEDCLKSNGFQINTEQVLDSALDSDLNIICSHGGNNISEVQIIRQSDKTTFNLDNVIGPGKILIFFVCYSGSMKTEYFRNNVTSLVKRYISYGYSAVIAPFWALDVTVPKYWLPEFLNSLNLGMRIDLAVFNANLKVFEQYPVPQAWACLHLYGNPLLRVE